MAEPTSPSRDMLACLTPAQRQLHQEFLGAVAAVRHDFVRMVLLIREVADRRIYRLLGFTTIAAYSDHYARFSEAQTREFMAIGGRLRTMDQVVAALGDGTLSWTKAREICRHADPCDQAHWIAAARRLSAQDLHDLLARPSAAVTAIAPVEADVPRGSAPGSAPLPVSEPAPVPSPRPAAPSRRSPPPRPKPPPCAPRPASTALPTTAPAVCHVPLRFSPEQYARFEALMSARYAGDPGTSREDIVLDALAGARGDQPRHRVGEPPPYLIVLLSCPDCDQTRLVTSRGEAPVARPLLEAVACDAIIEDAAGDRRRTVAPRWRRLALQRARFRCEAAGCRHTQFLEVHHRVPRERGGADGLDNLVVLCSRCHRALHEHEAEAAAATRSARDVARALQRPDSAEE